MATGDFEFNAKRGERPLVSVIIPSLNAAATLGRCLASVKDQTHPSIEIIVVDGGSSDLTREIAARFGAKFVPGLHRRSTARRVGAKEASGEYLLFVDSDQILETGLVEECISSARSHQADALKIPETDIGSGIWTRCRILERKFAACDELSYPRFVTRSAYDAIGGHRRGLEDYMEDRDLAFRLAEAGFTTAWISKHIFNDFGTTNATSLGLKGARAARDADVYYEGRREGIWSLIRPRLENFVRRPNEVLLDFPALVFLPLFLLVSYGPRLVMALIGNILAKRRTLRLKA